LPQTKNIMGKDTRLLMSDVLTFNADDHGS
jgi:hypothetical protein